MAPDPGVPGRALEDALEAALAAADAPIADRVAAWRGVLEIDPDNADAGAALAGLTALVERNFDEHG